MADNILTRDRDLAALDIAAKEIDTVKFPRNILVDPSGTDITPATETTMAALLSAAQAIQTAANALNTKTTAVNTGAIAGTVAVSNFPSGAGLTDTELRASPLAVTGNFYQATQPVSFTWAGLTDSQLRASPVGVAVSGTVPVSGTFWQATQPVSFTWAGLTDAQLRATAVPVSAASLPLPTGAATETTLATIAGAVSAHNAAAESLRPGMVFLVRRRDVDSELTVADGDFSFLNINDEGRLKVTTKPAVYQDVVGNITAIQATIGTPVAGGTVVADVVRASNVMAFCTGTFSTVNCAFEGSLEETGDTNWFSIQAVRSNANTIEVATGNLSAQPVYAWEMSVNGIARVRVRCTARTSGTQTWRFKLGTYATEPIPAAQTSATQPVSGTVTATVTPPAPATPYILNSAASTNEVLILTGTSGLHAFYATNTGAAVAFVKLYNKATAPASTDVPAMILSVPAAVSGVPGVCTLPIGFSGFRFALGLGIRITGAVADNDTTAVAAGQVKVMLSRTV